MKRAFTAALPALALIGSLLSLDAKADGDASNPDLSSWRQGDTAYYEAQTAMGAAQQIRTVMGVSVDFVRHCETLTYSDGWLAGTSVAQESLIRIRDGVIVKLWVDGRETAAPQHSTQLISRDANQSVRVMGRQVAATYSQYSASNFAGQFETWTNPAVAPFGGLLILKTPYLGGFTATVTQVQRGPGNLPAARCPAHP